MLPHLDDISHYPFSWSQHLNIYVFHFTSETCAVSSHGCLLCALLPGAQAHALIALWGHLYVLSTHNHRRHLPWDSGGLLLKQCSGHLVALTLIKNTQKPLPKNRNQQNPRLSEALFKKVSFLMYSKNLVLRRTVHLYGSPTPSILKTAL